MYVRLAFAVAINVDPEMLLIDEILAVGDVTFQQKCMEKFVNFREEGRTLVLVTHDLGSVRNFCDRAIWLEHGRLADEGPPDVLVDRYTEAMLADPDKEVPVDGARRGSGEIKVDRVEMIVGGSTVYRINTGDTVTFRLHFTATERVRNPVFGVTIGSLGGAVISQPCTRDVEQVPSWIEGSGVVDVVIDRIPLLPGPHVLHTEITGFGRQHVFDHIQNATRFDVIAGTSTEVEGLVTLHPTWSIEGEGVSSLSEMFE
jgi:hypothetical protein